MRKAKNEKHFKTSSSISVNKTLSQSLQYLKTKSFFYAFGHYCPGQTYLS